MPEEIDPLEGLAKKYELCFSTPVGREVLADLDRFHRDRSCSNKGPGEYYQPHEVLIRSGEQSVPMRIHELIELSEELTLLRAKKDALKPLPESEDEDD